MATIVRHKKSGKTYLLLGSGFGAFQSKKPNWFFGDLIADTAEGQFAMVCVCNAEGIIGWFESSQLVVDSVDGEPVQSYFSEDDLSEDPISAATSDITPLPETPSLISPIDITTSARPTLLWNRAKYATSYEVQVSADGLFSQESLIEQAKVKQTSYQADVAGHAAYVWRVRSVNRSGFSEWSNSARGAI